MKLYCEKCGRVEEYQVKAINQTFDVRGIQVDASINVSVCNVCGSEVFNRELEIQNDILVFDGYKEKKGLLTSKQIKYLREMYGLSQSAFARLLGFGEKTITRYENGSIQDDAHDNILRLMFSEENFFLLWRRIRKDMSDSDNKRVEAKISKEEQTTFEYNPKITTSLLFEMDSKGGLAVNGCN
ncbi:MAG: type II toxin-antitoxin system MqsA family antitoxin [Candidatus Izemoplasmatales bacterium]|nr:type II toxin-antitoxin system MqsA family antitoxin [Candidatus Izemoplasmatales bacterium]